ncbi:hypothetical protein M1M86_01730 [Dehalococcoidales bacterium]|nr:hypothetical protein [Dehalococcoidales bacterium]
MEVGIWKAILVVLIVGQFGLWGTLVWMNNGLRKELSRIGERLGKIEGMLAEHLREH